MPRREEKHRAGAQERLLEAALDIFGRDGYEAATTRVIARKAGVNIAAIPYYYNGKEGLYRAVVTHIVDLIRQQIDMPIRRINESNFDAEGKGRAQEVLEMMLTAMIHFMIGSAQGVRVARIILREQMCPSAAYDLIFSGFISPVMDALAVLIMTLAENTSDRTARMRALAIIGQVMAFRVARESMVRSIGLKGYDDDELEEIREIILEHTRNILKPLMQ